MATPEPPGTSILFNSSREELGNEDGVIYSE
jgi:hypothetical protein